MVSHSKLPRKKESGLNKTRENRTKSVRTGEIAGHYCKERLMIANGMLELVREHALRNYVNRGNGRKPLDAPLQQIQRTPRSSKQEQTRKLHSTLSPEFTTNKRQRSATRQSKHTNRCREKKRLPTHIYRQGRKTYKR